MSYAAPYYFRGYPQTETGQTTETASTVGRIYPVDATPQRCKRDTKRQTTARSDNYVADGFLRCSFLPKLYGAKAVQDSRKSENTERDFYQSLSLLAIHYDILPMQSRQYAYPYNIALAMDDAQKQLKDKVRDWEELHVIQGSRKTYLVSKERYNTGATLYYIPVVPLYRLSKNQKRKQAAQLLQSVCSYLYRIAHVVYYRQEGSYLYWMYEMLKDWIACDEVNEETSSYFSQLIQAEQIGERMKKKIANPYNLSRFKDRLNKFTIKDGFDHDCYWLACDTLELFEEFPNERIFRNARPNGNPDMEAEDDEMDNVITMDKYISFCADAKGLLFQTLYDNVNTELQEYGQTEEPIILNRFDGKDNTTNTLDFENRVFAVIEELVYILNGF